MANDSRQVGKDEIEITPEMIEAGLKVLFDSGRIEPGYMSGDNLLVGDIFRAMFALAPRRD